MKTTPLLSPTHLPPLGSRPGLTAPLANGYLSPNKVAVNPTPSILVGCSQKVVCIRVQGKGSFQNSTGIKDFAAAMILRGHRDFVVDLAGCPVMDSTFMGTLAGVAQRLLRLGQGGLHVINANERNTDLLQGLGLDQIVSMEGKDSLLALESQAETQDQLPAAPADKRTTTETMIAAHQALVDADPDNLCKFKDVLDYLKQDLRREETVD